MKSYQNLLLANKSWANSTAQADPEYFKRMAAGQSPEFLWIGCADSRAPADKLTGTEPGQIFVHRNVANLVINTDINLLSVLQYAVEVLKVKHIMVVGHTGCGGVRAAMGHAKLGLIDAWIKSIKDVYAENEAELKVIADDSERADRLAELNVIQQVKNLLKTSFVQEAWKQGEYPYVHGWMLDLKSGMIKQLCDVSKDDKDQILENVYQYAL
jgi:carbonic anhydrase